MYEGGHLGRGHTEERLQWSAIVRLRNVETDEDVATEVVTTLERALDDPFVYVFTRGENDGRLEPTARSERELTDVPRLDEGPVWEAFVEGRAEHRPDPDAHGTAACELAVPLGVHGVVLVGYTDRHGFTPAEEEVVNVVATTAEWRLDALDTRRRVAAAERAHERVLERERALQCDFNGLRGFVRDIVDADTRAAVETALVDRLVELSTVDAATVADVNPAGGLRTIRTRGDPIVAPSTDGPQPGTPLAEAFVSGTVQTVSDVIAFDGDPSWRRRVLDAGYQSVAALPLCWGTEVGGAVEVFATVPGRYESLSVVDEMVDIAAAAIAAFERRESLFAGRDLEVEFGFSVPTDPLFALARAAGTPLAFREFVPRGDGAGRFYFESATSLPLDVLRDEPDVFRVERVDSESPRYLVELAHSAVVDVLTDEGAALDRVAIEDGEGRLAARVTPTTDVRSLLERCAPAGGGRLVRQTPVPAGGVARREGAPTDVLTDRQREVLRCAHHGGFFDWPRAHTGEEIAAKLEIAPATFHQHVRTGTSRVFDALFD